MPHHPETTPKPPTFVSHTKNTEYNNSPFLPVNIEREGFDRLPVDVRG
jgi:hypothetical protein